MKAINANFSAWCLFWLLFGCRTATTSTVQLVGGHVAALGEFPEVFFVNGCTATKIGPSAVLLAAHCVLNKETGDLWDEFRTGANVDASFSRPVDRDDLTSIPIIKTHVFPAYWERHTKGRSKAERSGIFFDTPDIALLHVGPAARIEAAFHLMPPAKLDARPVMPGEAVTIMGFGAEGDNYAADAPPRLKVARVAVTPASEVSRVVRSLHKGDRVDHRLAFAVISSPEDPHHVNLGGGDSGGPVFRVDAGHRTLMPFT